MSGRAGAWLAALLACACRPEAPAAGTATGTGTTTGEGANSSTTSGSTTTGSPTTSSTSSSTGEGSTTIENAFIRPSDMPGCPPFAAPWSCECSVWSQDCSPGEKCAPWSGDGDEVPEAKKCVPVFEEAVAVGSPCTVEGNPVSGIDNCELGALCWNVDPELLTGTCMPQCAGTPDAPDCSAYPGTECVVLHQEVTTLCLGGCDPLVQDCAPGQACVGADEAPEALFCALDGSGDGGGAFDGCATIGGCDPGLRCAPSAAASECDQELPGCCLPFCDVNAPACPGAGQVCAPWYNNGAPAGLEHVGACALP